MEPEIMQRASMANHNRLHLGYHYLRSLPTAVQSLEGLLSFLFNYGDAAIHQFPNYYAIAKHDSKTSVDDFIRFCDTVGIGYDAEYPPDNLLNKEMVEACFVVPEPIFDYDFLKRIISQRLNRDNINLILNASCTNVNKHGNIFKAQINNQLREYDVVVNSSYAAINTFNKMLGVVCDQYLYEDVLIPFFLYPSDKFGLTVMDGEFCSIMPKGNNKNEFLLYHVRDSVLDSSNNNVFNSEASFQLEAVIKKIFESSSEFFPFVSETKEFGYWRTTRIVRENSVDSRVSELFTYPEVENYYAILSGKISTCMRVALQLRKSIEGKSSNKNFKI